MVLTEARIRTATHHTTHSYTLAQGIRRPVAVSAQVPIGRPPRRNTAGPHRGLAAGSRTHTPRPRSCRGRYTPLPTMCTRG